MGAALLLALALAGGGRFERTNSRTEQGRSDRGLMSSSGALFEFAPLSGAGMGAACACSAVTGAKGEALTFSRASVGSCIKGSTTSLANGDMVICASGQPRVMPGGDGTGGLGLLVEGGGTNVVTRSEALDNAAFADYTAGGAAAPVVTADAATSPTGTVTADMLSLPATAAGEGSGRSIAVLTAAAYSAQAYVLGVTGTGVIDLCVETSTGGTCTPCSFTTSAWTPCVAQNVTSVAGGRVIVGNMSDLNGGDPRDAVSVFVWGLDAKLGSRITSYVPTAGSAVTRPDETAWIAASLPAANVGSMAATVVTSSATVDYISIVVGSSVAAPTPITGADQIILYTPATYGASWRCLAGNAAATLFTTGVVASPGLSWRGWCAMDGVVTGAAGGTAMSASGALSGTFNSGQYIVIGGSKSQSFIYGVVKQICRDPDPTRCR